MSPILQNNKAYSYAIGVKEGIIVAPKYVKIVCTNFINDLLDPDCKYFIDEKELKIVEGLLKLINMATGLSTNVSCFDALADFQWFFILNALLWKHKDNPKKRRYEKSVLLIARKSGKSFLIALIFILMMLLEPEYSEFYSVAPDRDLSSIVKKEVEQLINSSHPSIKKQFYIVRGEVRCLLKNSKFVPLACSDNRMDGRKATVFVADEVGALKNRYPIDAMASSQMNMLNRTGILISTAYESLSNPMTEEVDYITKVLDGLIEDETVFGLLYMPDDPKDWLSDKSLIEANPLVTSIPENLTYLKKQRQLAVDMPSMRKNFLTKHMNIFVDGNLAEVYIATEDLLKCKIKKYDWAGKKVYVGVDLSQTSDNTSISFVTYDEDQDEFIAKSFAFIPAGRVDEKSKIEKIDYYKMMENGWCYECGDSVISYDYVEEFVMALGEKYGVEIMAIGYDRYNCISSAGRWEKNGFDTIEVRQHSAVLHPATKRLKEAVLERRFKYESNDLYERNFANAKKVEDANLNMYISKKKSSGKVDMVVSTIISMVLWLKFLEEGASVYEERGLAIL